MVVNAFRFEADSPGYEKSRRFRSHDDMVNTDVLSTESLEDSFTESVLSQTADPLDLMTKPS